MVCDYTQLDPERYVMSAWYTYTLPPRILTFPLTSKIERKKIYLDVYTWLRVLTFKI